MKTKLIVLSFLLVVSAAALAACGSKADPKQQSSAGTAPAAAQSDKNNAAADDAAIKEGTAKLLSAAKQLRKAATAGDEAKIKEQGPKLEQAWSAFEDGVKPKYPDIYEQVEKNLNPLVAAAQASSIDKDAVLKADNQLIQVLYDLSGKLIPVEQIKAGANQMLETANALKKEIEAGNEAKVKELGPKLEDVWKTFEDGVPPRSADLYEKVEKSLNPEVAGSQKSPIDKQVLAQLNEGLTTALNELVQTIK
jgi:iron uptake system EfeUOB component EfeO/EfeM